jgi:hypothetical protein
MDANNELAIVKLMLVEKLASLPSGDLIRAAAPGVFAGGGYGAVSGLLNPGVDSYGNRRSAISEALKRALVGSIVGGTLTSQFPVGIDRTDALLRRGINVAGNTIRQVRESQRGGADVESLIDSLLTGDR